MRVAADRRPQQRPAHPASQHGTGQEEAAATAKVAELPAPPVQFSGTPAEEAGGPRAVAVARQGCGVRALAWKEVARALRLLLSSIGCWQPHGFAASSCCLWPAVESLRSISDAMRHSAAAAPFRSARTAARARGSRAGRASRVMMLLRPAVALPPLLLLRFRAATRPTAAMACRARVARSLAGLLGAELLEHAVDVFAVERGQVVERVVRACRDDVSHEDLVSSPLE